MFSGSIRLGVPDDYAARYLTPVLRRFAPHHGAVEIELICEQSTALIPRVERGDLDLALVSRDHPRHGTLLFHEPMVWVGADSFQLWRRDPLPIAVYEDASLAGQIAAVESGLAVAVLTQCSAPAHLRILGSDEGLGPLEPMEVAVYRSRASHGAKAVDGLHDLLIKTLRLSPI